MFTIPTLPKILIIVAVIAVLWWWHRRNQIKAREREELGKGGGRAARTKSKNSPAKPVEDMAKCRVCGAYVPTAGATNCGRDDCPF